jgi:hypothetical protein
MTDPRETAERKAGKWLITFALVFAAAVVTFGAYQRIRQTNILATPDWCARAINAEKLTPGRQETSCGELMKIQLKAVATNSHIDAGAQAIALIAIILLVVAGGNLTLAVSKTGANLGLSRSQREAAAAGANEAAGAAKDKADDIAGGAKPQNFTPPDDEPL